MKDKVKHTEKLDTAIKNTSKETQRIAILAALRGGSKSTIQFRCQRYLVY